MADEVGAADVEEDEFFGGGDGFDGAAMAKLKFLVIIDPLRTETAEFWKNFGEQNNVKPEEIKTEVIRLPACCFAEDGGTFTCAGRVIQWHGAAAEPPGEGKTVNWPVGVGGRGNAGVAANVSKIAGSIGYVEFAYAKQNKIAYAQQVNRDGRTVQADDVSFGAAADKAEWNSAPGFGVSLNNQPGAAAWPITSASFILMHKNAADPKRSARSWQPWPPRGQACERWPGPWLLPAPAPLPVSP
jgi:anaerobic selenocysteine-containing dehydrogenase